MKCSPSQIKMLERMEMNRWYVPEEISFRCGSLNALVSGGWVEVDDKDYDREARRQPLKPPDARKWLKIRKIK